MIIGTARSWAEAPAGTIRSSGGGNWSDAATWEGGQVPGAGATVLVRAGHRVVYDIEAGQAVRAVYVAGTLTFARDRDTLLEVGFLRVGGGEAIQGEDFECHMETPGHAATGHVPPDAAALEVGTPQAPIRQSIARSSGCATSKGWTATCSLPSCAAGDGWTCTARPWMPPG